MDRELVAQKLESLRRCVRRLEERCPESPRELAQDADAQDIVSLNLSRAIQLCVDMGAHWLSEHEEQDVPATMGEVFTELNHASIIDEQLAGNLRRAVGFRNLVVHNYEKIDWEIVYTLCTERLEDFRRFAEVLDAFLAL